MPLWDLTLRKQELNCCGLKKAPRKQTIVQAIKCKAMEDIVEESLLLKCVQVCSNNGFYIFSVSFQYLANNDALCTTF